MPLKSSLPLILLVLILACLAPGEPAGADIRCFHFAPSAAPGFRSFIKVGGDSVYTKSNGYGWLDLNGTLEKGKWEGDEFNAWEAWENLNLVCRIGPDDLARSYFTGPATFALDLKPGKYEIWVLTGDWGLRESTPHEPYKIVIEGVTVYDFKATADEFYREFETPPSEDDLTQLGVWQRYVEPRFRWIRTVIDVADGQLNINVGSEQREKSVLDFMGDYAITETRGGPNRRFAGALNALVVMAAADNGSGRAAIERTDARRQEDFASKWPLKSSQNQKSTEFTGADYRRGYTVFSPHALEPVHPGDRMPNDEKTIKVRATPGEYVPITFGICPLKDLGPTRAEFSNLRRSSEGGKVHLDTKGNLASGIVRYVARPTGRGEKSWRPGPAIIAPGDTWNILDGVAKQFWLTFKVPEETPPGAYEGEINISPEKAERTAVRVELEILPFKLMRPTHIAVGLTYFSPVQYAYFGEERFWKRMEAEFNDMRAHNMTCVQYTGIRMDDYRRMDRALSLYRAAGFENPVYLLESHGAMWRLRRNGIAWDTQEFHTKYVQFIREFLEEVKRRNWPPIIINFGDEFTNKGIEEFGAKVARNLKTIPGIVTAADTNGYKEVTLMAPVVDIVAFDNGWDGPNGVNRDKRLLKKETVDLIKKAGAAPWLVNVGIDRFTNGYWLWKMARLGVRGKMEWIYRGYYGMPFNGFDANPLNAPIVYPGPDGTAIPSLGYELMRMGLDDLAYLYTLERVTEEKRNQPAKQAAVASADHFLEQLSEAIEDDMNKYYERQHGSEIPWRVERYDAVRSEAIDLILRLQGR